MAEFKEGDIVNHKATMKRGVIAEKGFGIGGNQLRITWSDGTQSQHTPAELYTEEEFKRLNPPQTV